MANLLTGIHTCERKPRQGACYMHTHAGLRHVICSCIHTHCAYHRILHKHCSSSSVCRFYPKKRRADSSRIRSYTNLCIDLVNRRGRIKAHALVSTLLVLGCVPFYKGLLLGCWIWNPFIKSVIDEKMFRDSFARGGDENHRIKDWNGRPMHQHTDARRRRRDWHGCYTCAYNKETH